MKLKNSNCYKTQKLKLWWNSETQIVLKLKNTKCDKTKKNQIVTKLKNLTVTKLKKTNNFDKTQKLWLWQNSKCDKNLIVKKNQKIKMWKTQSVTKLKNINDDKTQKLKLWQNLSYYQSQFMKNFFKGSFSKTILRPWQLISCFLGSALRFSQLFFFTISLFLLLLYTHLLKKFSLWNLNKSWNSRIKFTLNSHQ